MCILKVGGLSVATCQVLALPLDVSNSKGLGGGLRMDILWQLIYIVVYAFVFVLIPYALFYYEADDEIKSV
jgi:LMBR1 domain-containing protein 1